MLTCQKKCHETKEKSDEIYNLLGKSEKNSSTSKIKEDENISEYSFKINNTAEISYLNQEEISYLSNICMTFKFESNFILFDLIQIYLDCFNDLCNITCLKLWGKNKDDSEECFQFCSENILSPSNHNISTEAWEILKEFIFQNLEKSNSTLPNKNITNNIEVSNYSNKSLEEIITQKEKELQKERQKLIDLEKDLLRYQKIKNSKIR